MKPAMEGGVWMGGTQGPCPGWTQASLQNHHHAEPHQLIVKKKTKDASQAWIHHSTIK